MNEIVVYSVVVLSDVVAGTIYSTEERLEHAAKLWLDASALRFIQSIFKH